MRNLKLIIIGLLISQSIFAQPIRRIIKASGEISEKCPINMTLSIDNEKVLGFYYNEDDKRRTKKLLVGQIKENEITLNESPNYELDFNIGFIGEFKDRTITGEWFDKTKDINFSFELIQESDSLLQIGAQTSVTEGLYENVLNSEKYFSSVMVKYISDGIYCFEISNGTESGCIGYLMDLITICNLTTAIYSSDLCEELHFLFTNRKLKITEKNCEFHGARCPFDGNYNKK